MSKKFNTPAERRRFAIRKKYISDEEWTRKELANELNVTERTISSYLNDNPHAEEVKQARDAIAEDEMKQMVMDLKQRVDRLSELEDQLWDVVEPVVTAYELVPTTAEISNFSLQDGGNSVTLDMPEGQAPQKEVEIPVPAKWKEVPEFSRLRSVWDERRKTEEQLANVLGITDDDTLSIEGELTERKIFEVDDGYPDAQPHEQGESPPGNTEDADEQTDDSEDSDDDD